MVTENMKTWKKVAIGIGVLVVLAIIVGITVRQSGKERGHGADREGAASGLVVSGERLG